MPIATVITPGTLEVRSDLGHNVTYVKVPQPYYNISNYGDFGSTGFADPNYVLIRIATISMLQSQILTSQSHYANQSYSQTFHCPTIKCEPANSTYIDALTSVFVYGMEGVAWTYQYLGWMGGDDHDLNNKSGYNLLSSQDLYNIVDVIQTETPRLFLVYNNESASTITQSATRTCSRTLQSVFFTIVVILSTSYLPFRNTKSPYDRLNISNLRCLQQEQQPGLILFQTTRCL